MFDKKKQMLFETATSGKGSTITKDPFLRAAIKSDIVLSGQGSEKLKTTGSDFVDQFASASKYKEPRSYAEVSMDMQVLWSQDPLLALKLTVYLRMITRKTKFHDGTTTQEVQVGQGLKHEGIMRMLWIAVNHFDVFVKNLGMFIVAGSWKDIFTMMQYDAMYHGSHTAFNWKALIALIGVGLEHETQHSLVKKYLPTIRAKSKCKTVEAQADNLVAKAIVKELIGYTDDSDAMKARAYKKYRLLKTSGTAHEWQKQISQRRFEDIEFNKIAGRALNILVNSKFLENQGLIQKYEAWIMKQPVAKYTGYVYELFAPVVLARQPLPNFKEFTINAQFNHLVEQARADMVESDNGLLCVLDTSGSMSADAIGTKITAYDVAKSMTLFFSELLKGRFHNHYFEFSKETIHKQFKGSTPIEKYNSCNSRIAANTDFNSVAHKLGEIKLSGVDESDFPSGILCLSDGELDSSFTHWTASNNRVTEVEKFRQDLKSYGFSDKFVEDFKIILWDIPNGYYGKPTPKFEALGDTPNTFHIGGLDGSVISFLTGRKLQESTSIPKTSEELFLAAMNQELLHYLQV